MSAENIREDVFLNRLVSYQTTWDYAMAKARAIFSYEDLPETVPPLLLEKYLVEDGAAVLYVHDGDLFVTRTRPHSHPDVYGRNTHVSIEHTVDGQTTTLERVVGLDAVEVLSDPDGIGLEPLVNEYAIMSAQAKLTMLRTFVDLRTNYFIQAKDENARRSALAFEDAIRRGDTSVLFAEELDSMEGVIVHNTPSSGSAATQTIELMQYVQSQYYSELGISIQNNMKREYVNEAELSTPNGAALIWVMEYCRQKAMQTANALFGLDIKVRLSNDWSNQDDRESPAEDEQDLGEPADEADEDAEPTEPDADEADTDEPDLEDLTREEVTDVTEAMTGEGDTHAHQDHSASDDADA